MQLLKITQTTKAVRTTETKLKQNNLVGGWLIWNKRLKVFQHLA